MNLLMLDPSKDEIKRSLEKAVKLSGNMTAVFCCSDFFATMFMESLRSFGREVPEDISVMGFDDMPVSRVCSPRLTTTHQSAEDKGSIAAEMLLKVLKGEELKERQITLPHSLVERESVRDISEKR